jgi:hypothetical protein
LASTVVDPLIILLLALEEQLVASRHEVGEAHLSEVLLTEDLECMMVAGIRQGVGVALATMQLRTGVNLRRVTPGFLEHARQEERTAWVNDFAAAADTIVAVVDVEEILHDGGL